VSVDDLLDRGVVAVTSAVTTGQADPVEVTDAAVARCATATVGTFTALDADHARGQVRDLVERMSRGERLPLAGLPIAVKDLIDVAGLPTGYGHPSLARVAAVDATVVARLRGAGAIVVGKTGLHELAYGVTGANPHTGTPANPAAADRMPGGSSSGSAVAVATRAVPAALGTDTGGSVRIPAACCAVVGLKPTRGCVPVTGVMPLAWLQDTVGTLTRDVADAAALLAVLAGRDPADPVSIDPPASWAPTVPPRMDGLVVSLPEEMWAGTDGATAAVLVAAVERLVDRGLIRADLSLPGYAAARRAQGVLLDAQALAVHGQRLGAEPDAFGLDVRERLDAARRHSAADVAVALRVRDEWRAQLRSAVGDGLLVTPSIGFPPPALGAETAPSPDGDEPVTPALTRRTGVFNLAGWPALSVPVGTDHDGLPASIQIAGPPWSEPLLLAAGAAVSAPSGP